MDDLIAAVVIIAVVIVGGTFAVSAVLGYSKRRTNSRPGHSDKAELANWKLAQEAVRILDHLMSDDMTRCVIPNATQKQIRSLSDRFYNS